jgi:hypothetical protein
MKMKMKTTLIYHSFLMVGQKKNENVIIFTTHDGVHRPLDTMWHLIQLELWL